MNLGKPEFDEAGGLPSAEIEPRQTTDIAAADKSPTASNFKKRSSLGATTNNDENKKEKQLANAKLMANSTVGVSPGLKRRQPGA